MLKNKLLIREIQPSEYPVLETFLYLAIFQKDTNNLFDKSIIFQPEIYNYIANFGKPSDLCIVAIDQQQIIGAVWTRILAFDIIGFGNIDKQTPEFAISLLPNYRHQGIGTLLMQKMLEQLSKRGFTQASLSVNKANDALFMYQKLGFKIIEERDHDYLMVIDF